MSKFNDEAGGGGGDGMVSPLKNEILPITGLVLKIAYVVLPYSLLLPFYVIFIAFNPKNLFFF
jgi:hypothetical protein